MSKRFEKWCKRRIRPNGFVKAWGHWHKLTDFRNGTAIPVAEYEALASKDRCSGQFFPAYDGRLDGRTGIFYRYENPSDSQMAHTVYLHSMVSELGEVGDSGPAVAGVIIWDHWIDADYLRRTKGER
jgi:hypothetical protein